MREKERRREGVKESNRRVTVGFLVRRLSRMQSFDLVLASSLSIFAYYVISPLPLVACLSHEDVKNHQKRTGDSINKLSSKKISDITLHGILLWVSMGFLMPLGILTIRMSLKEGGAGRRRAFFYLHVILQVLAVLLATAGAISSIKSFENSFDNNHQRIGLALYGAIWLQAVLGFLRPRRGNKRRTTWYCVHWILGTMISLVGMINIYTGLNAYHNKISSRSTRLWTILFTAQVSSMAIFYLFQDKWEYMQKQGVILGDVNEATMAPPTGNDQSITTSNHTSGNQKVLAPEPCAKRNALRNLFD